MPCYRLHRDIAPGHVRAGPPQVHQDPSRQEGVQVSAQDKATAAAVFKRTPCKKSFKYTIDQQEI